MATNTVNVQSISELMSYQIPGTFTVRQYIEYDMNRHYNYNQLD